jgi:hypothetical protein
MGNHVDFYAYIFFILLTTYGQSPKFIHKFMGLVFVFFITIYVCAYTKSRPVQTMGIQLSSCQQAEECPINSNVADNLNTKGWYDDVY